MKENKRRPYRNWKKNGRKGHFVRARADSAEPTRKMRVEAPEVPWDNKYLDDPVTDGGVLRRLFGLEWRGRAMGFVRAPYRERDKQA